MNFRALEDSAKVFRFELSDVSNSYANALRRASINSVKTFAIDSVTFYENSSAMFDEYIAHRIGLIPIITPSKGYDEKDEVLFVLDATGPCMVYAKDLETREKEIRVAAPNIPIIKLGKGQRIRLEGKAVMGQALEHAKFQPGLVTYDQTEKGFEFYVETFGQMPPREIINKACLAIIYEVKEIGKQAKKL